MELAAPTLVNPVGRHLLDLPFVNSSERTKLKKMIQHIFYEPAEHTRVRTVMLHLHTQNGPVLLEMRCTVLGTAGAASVDSALRRDELIIVLTGREVEESLAGLLVCESIISGDDDENDGDGGGDGGDDGGGDSKDGRSAVFRFLGPSVSAIGDAPVEVEPARNEIFKEGGSVSSEHSYSNDDERESNVSSLTMPTIDQNPSSLEHASNGSKVSSLTHPSSGPSYLDARSGAEYFDDDTTDNKEALDDGASDSTGLSSFVKRELRCHGHSI